MNPYQVLGARPDADVETLRALYRQLVRLHHPDRAPDEAARQKANQRMIELNHAWHIVGDPQRRAAHDARARWEQVRATRGKLQYQPSASAATPQAAAATAATATTAATDQARERELRNLREVELLEQQLHRRRRPPVRAGKEQAVRELNELLQLRIRDKVEGRGRRRPSARRQMIEAARLFWEEDRPSEALALCHGVLRADSRNVAVRELLGDFYLQLGRGDRALPLWEQALVFQPDNAALRRKLRALRPHEARSYAPQPRMPRRDSDFDRQLQIQRAAQIKPSSPSLWSRLRARLGARLRARARGQSYSER